MWCNQREAADSGSPGSRAVLFKPIDLLIKHLDIQIPKVTIPTYTPKIAVLLSVNIVLLQHLWIWGRLSKSARILFSLQTPECWCTLLGNLQTVAKSWWKEEFSGELELDLACVILNEMVLYYDVNKASVVMILGSVQSPDLPMIPGYCCDLNPGTDIVGKYPQICMMRIHRYYRDIPISRLPDSSYGRAA